MTRGEMSMVWDEHSNLEHQTLETLKIIEAYL